MLPGHPSLHSPVLLGVPPGMGCKSQPLSLFSSCRAPGDEEAQAENLITANGKATRPACSAAASARHQPAAELAARDGGFAVGWVLQTALLFPLQPRERRKQRTEHEPCGESQGGHGPAQASVGGGTGAVTAAVLGGKRGACGAPSGPVCWDWAALQPDAAGMSTGRGCGRETHSAGQVRGVLCSASPRQEREASVRIFVCMMFPFPVLLHPKVVLFLGPLEI